MAVAKWRPLATEWDARKTSVSWSFGRFIGLIESLQSLSAVAVGNSLWGMWRVLHGDGVALRNPLGMGRRAASILLDADLGSKV
ncbi:hypothetical protein AU381_10770 [Sinorhizobium glycinis]|uniref:Uncharacterized protein n=1 Tax=Sinorhizobium glycinis TaxID=1472378 RepID=A0A178XZ40_9HYPH|nr:hypothetical protein [Sinorhizobium glycinis]OAP40013.1 hypothetical protein AU381_10770 [Sinorhizobium glycinis]